MRQDLTRRELLAGAGAGVGALLARPAWSRALPPRQGSDCGSCKTYGTAVGPPLENVFDQLGGLGGW